MAMRMVTFSARALLLIASLIWAAITLRGGAVVSSHLASWALIGHVAGFYALTWLTFFSFPFSRRQDLMLGVILGGLIDSAMETAGAGFSVSALAADLFGMIALYAPTELEGARKRLRDNPSAFPFGRTADDRRERGRREGIAGTGEIALARIAAWSLVAVIFVTTLGPLSLRPRLADPQLERFCAYLLAAAAFTFAHRRSAWTIGAGFVVLAAGLEVGQLFVPGRDAHIVDAVAKGLGGATGAAIMGLGLSLWARKSPRRLRRTLSPSWTAAVRRPSHISIA